MSDSIKDKPIETFDALQQVKDICDSGLIRLADYISVEYKPGWATVVKDMLTRLKSFDILLISITSDYGELDVHFESSQIVHELKAWRAIEDARNQSRSKCMECGYAGQPHLHDENIIVLCRSCAKSFAGVGKTGTWLDRY